MNDFRLTRCYGSSTSTMNNRKISRSDLAFQKLKKYEEKYKTNQTPVRRNSGSVEADSESDIQQYKTLISKYAGPRDSHQDSPTNPETSKHVLQKVEDFAIKESLVNGYTRSPDKRSHVPKNNKSLIIDLKIDNVHLVNSDDSKIELSTNLFPNAGQDRNHMSYKKSFDAAKITAQQNKIRENMPSMKAIANNSSIESDTSDYMSNLHRHIAPHDSHIHPEDDQIYSNTLTADKKIPFHTNSENENKTVDLQLTDEIKELQQPSESVEYYQEQNKNESSKQINCDLLSNREMLSAEPESISTEIFESTSDSDVTSYEVPDISNSNNMDVRDKSKCSHFGTVVASESSVTSGNDVLQKTDDKATTVPSSDNTINSHLNNAILLCSKCKRSLKKQCKSQTYETHCYCHNKSTQTNISVDCLHHMNHVQHSNTTALEDTVLSPYNLFVYHHLLHSYSKDSINKDLDPAVRFLNKSLMEQVSITQYVINSQHAMHKAYCTAARNLSKSYQPVTLENTMQFIKQSRKKKKEYIGLSMN